MSLVLFLRDNIRWLVGGMLLTFFSSIGQTFFIALFAGEIRAEYDLSHGEFGAYYMIATLASAATLVSLGKVVDVWSAGRVASITIVCLAGACLVMATARGAVTLLLALYLLRLFGQGMMSHTAMTAMGRWFVAARGRAVSITSTGHQLGEGMLPLIIAVALGFVSWRTIWWISAATLLLVALPLIHLLLSTPRMPGAVEVMQSERGRQWTRAEVLRDSAFWVVISGVLAPAFIGTSVFFHQIHLAELKAWPLSVVASSFAVLSVTTIVVTLTTGRLIDRYSARRLLPFFLLPLGVACIVLARAEHPLLMAVFMLFLGISYGISSAVFGAIWPELYGTRHLGAVRSVVFAAMVFASAVGPGLTGWGIDAGVGLEQQLQAMSLWCVVGCGALFSLRPSLDARVLAN